ncbi:MBL fold metallo-hydrolase [Chitinophaga pendula]|uniref:MBL fold metallo-hydrolase n=1 Tax=Chitinophaga TaxID=79328 RepID=UPI000BAF8A2C|nr:MULTISPECIES: MBL fold metallo-hydrolase [Chitinophaga]ASZ12604.1 MBL fold metallo-hydrolase [Chitinophaga sp. MD30]UCJ09792.1 MBL fold metallo-hydrolase [Chitinophaga pendula]
MEVKMFEVSGSNIRNQCYLIYQQRKGILVDPAWDYHLINDFLLDNRIMVKAVLLTHAHPDHIDLAADFARNKGIPAYMSAEEIDKSGFSCPNLVSVRHLDTFTLADFNITPILTPGHTSGSTCFLLGPHLFTGDTVFIEGVGICDHRHAALLFDSIQLLKAYLPGRTLIWPGHSFGDDPGQELRFLLKNNIYFQFEKKEEFIDFRMRKNRPNPFAFR